MRSTRLRRLCAEVACSLFVCAGVACAAPAAKAPPAAAARPASQSGIEPAAIDINSASHSQLKTLPGIGDVEADRIISGRPYFSKADLATRDVIPTGVYLSLKGRLIAKQKTMPKRVAAP